MIGGSLVADLVRMCQYETFQEFLYDVEMSGPIVGLVFKL